jgi:hypothetical protein
MIVLKCDKIKSPAKENIEPSRSLIEVSAMTHTGFLTRFLLPRRTLGSRLKPEATSPPCGSSPPEPSSVIGLSLFVQGRVFARRLMPPKAVYPKNERTSV